MTDGEISADARRVFSVRRGCGRDAMLARSRAPEQRQGSVLRLILQHGRGQIGRVGGVHAQRS